MTTEEKKLCENCAPKPHTSISVTDIYHPHCAHCGRCLDGRCVQLKHDGTVLTPPETGKETVREKFKKLLMVDMSEQDADKAVEFLLSIVREAVSAVKYEVYPEDDASVAVSEYQDKILKVLS